MRRIASAILGLLFVSAALADPTTQPIKSGQPIKTGEFEITYTHRSPESEYSKLIARIGLSKETLGPDYDLSQEPLVAYVPQNYDPKKPSGLIIWIWQDGSSDVYTPLRPILDEKNLIVVATHKDHRPLLNAVGLCFDIAFNLRQTYNIDPSRIYFIGLGQTEEPIGWSTGDLFMGDVYIGWVGYNKPLWTTQPLFQVNPPPRLMNLAKDHIQILAYPAGQDSKWYVYIADAMRADGFNYVALAPASHDQLPQPAWFRQTLQQLASIRSHPVAMHPTTAPASSDEPTRLLHLAQAYIASGLTDKAKDKLNQLIQSYPNDPAAAKAKELLAQIGAK
jgi:hypothetical protein